NRSKSSQAAGLLKALGGLLGLLQVPPQLYLQSPTRFQAGGAQRGAALEAEKIEALIEARRDAKSRRESAEADRIRADLLAAGIELGGRPGGVTPWRGVCPGMGLLQSGAGPADTPVYWDEAVDALVARDRILRRIIPQYGDVWLSSPDAPFLTLARALIGHQSSAKAAGAAWQRLTAGCGNQLTPEAVLQLAAADSTLAGLPKRKAEYIIDLAGHFAEKKVQPAQWGGRDDEAVGADL